MTPLLLTPMKSTKTEQVFTGWVERFENLLQQSIPGQDTDPELLHRAMRYSALSGGKRVRPLLVYASGQAFQSTQAELDAVACSVELIHAYSLIHDDLPAMDDDDLRRGKPTCHLAFGEATAILAGDALQALAFQTLAAGLVNSPESAATVTQMLARACGSAGMAGGQILDLEATGQAIDIQQLEHIHELKTGALIRCSVVIPAILASADPDNVAALERFGSCVGLGFQIRDDILDVTGTTANMGKNTRADAERHKPTFPSLIGLDASNLRAKELRDESLACLSRLPGDTSALAWLADFMISRDR